MGLKITYASTRFVSGGIGIYSGHARIPEIGLGVYGKGATPVLSRASAFAEMAERFSCTPSQYLSVNEFEDHPVLHRMGRSLFIRGAHERQMQLKDIRAVAKDLFRGRVQINESMISAIVDEGDFGVWVAASDLDSGEIREFPICLINRISMTNGLAAGNTHEEALAQAICEIVERHVRAQFLVKGKEAPTVRLNSIKDEGIRRYLKLFSSLNCRAIIKDLSFGMGYPAVALMLVDETLKNVKNPFRRMGHRIRVMVGCDTNIRVALLRSFTETFQNLTKTMWLKERHSKISDAFWKHWIENREFYPKPADDDLWEPLGHTHYFVRSDDVSFFESCDREIDFKDLPDYASDDSLDDVMKMVSLLNDNNYRAYAIDCTHPVVRFPSVQVIVPGMSDMIDFYPDKWIGDDGIVDYALGWDTNLTKYAKDNSWTESMEGIGECLLMLERRFEIYGAAESITIDSQDVPLFYIAYIMSLYLSEPERSLRYLRTLRALCKREDRPELSSGMLIYLEGLASGQNENDALMAVRKRFGRARMRMIGNAMRRYSLESGPFDNPFGLITGRRPKRLPRRFARILESYFDHAGVSRLS